MSLVVVVQLNPQGAVVDCRGQLVGGALREHKTGDRGVTRDTDLVPFLHRPQDNALTAGGLHMVEPHR